MKQPMCAVFDKKTGLYDSPFVVRHVGEAIREWETVKKDDKTKFGKNPEDFDLFHVGDYDYATGKMENLSPHYPLAQGV